MLVLEWKGRAFIEKVNSRCFCWFPAAILVDSFCPPIWRLHTKLYKGAWNVSATNSETVGHKDLRFGQIVYILVFYNISFSWLLSLDGFRCIFLCRVYCVTVKTKNMPKVKSALTTIFPAFLVRENWPVTGVVKRSRLWHNKIESLLQKVELGSTWRNMLPQLATSKFVAWQVESEGGNTGNNAFQLAMQQCCATSWAKMLPVLLDLKGL